MITTSPILECLSGLGRVEAYGWVPGIRRKDSELFHVHGESREEVIRGGGCVGSVPTEERIRHESSKGSSKGHQWGSSCRGTQQQGQKPSRLSDLTKILQEHRRAQPNECHQWCWDQWSCSNLQRESDDNISLWLILLLGYWLLLHPWELFWWRGYAPSTSSCFPSVTSSCNISGDCMYLIVHLPPWEKHDTLQELPLQQPQWISYATGCKSIKRSWGGLLTMLKMLAVEIFRTAGLPSFSSSSIGSSPSRLVRRPTWNSEVLDTWRRMFIRILCFTPWVKRWWIPSLCFAFKWSPAFVDRTSSSKRRWCQYLKVLFISFLTQDLIDGLAVSIQENNSLLQLLL